MNPPDDDLPVRLKSAKQAICRARAVFEAGTNARLIELGECPKCGSLVSYRNDAHELTVCQTIFDRLRDLGAQLGRYGRETYFAGVRITARTFEPPVDPNHKPTPGAADGA